MGKNKVPYCYDKATESEYLWNGKACGLLLVSSSKNLPTVVQGGTNHKLATGHWVPEAHRCTRATKAIPSGPSQRKVYCGTMHTKLIMLFGGMHHNTVHHTLLFWGLCSSKYLWWPLSTVKSTYNEHTNVGAEPWKKIAWSNESHFLLHHTDGRVCVHHLPGVGWYQDALRDNNKLVEEMFCWE